MRIYILENSFDQSNWLEWSGWSVLLGCLGWSRCSGTGGHGGKLCKWKSGLMVMWSGVVCCGLVWPGLVCRDSQDELVFLRVLWVLWLFVWHICLYTLEKYEMSRLYTHSQLRVVQYLLGQNPQKRLAVKVTKCSRGYLSFILFNAKKISWKKWSSKSKFDPG